MCEPCLNPDLNTIALKRHLQEKQPNIRDNLILLDNGMVVIFLKSPYQSQINPEVFMCEMT